MFSIHRNQPQFPPITQPRRASIIVLSAFLLVVVLAFAALAIDLSYISLTRTRMQNACDAAALAAVMEISHAAQNAAPGVTNIDAYALQQARLKAAEVAAYNGAYVDPQTDVEFGQRTIDATGAQHIEWGGAPANVVRVTARKDNPDLTAADAQLSLFFAPVLGHDSALVTTQAAAFIEPRDIVVVHDFSRSMNYDSWFSAEALSRMTRTQIESNMQLVYTDLAMNDGSMVFTPRYLEVTDTADGFSATVTFRYNVADVSANEEISEVVLAYTDGSQQVLAGNAMVQTFQGTGSNASKDIASVSVTTTRTIPGTPPTPSAVTLTGAAPTSSRKPQIYVTFHESRKSVFVQSSKDLSNVVLEFCDGVTYKFDGLTAKTGTFQGIGGNANKKIMTVWVKSGSNASGDGPGYGERFDNPTAGTDCGTTPPPPTYEDVTVTCHDTNANVMAMFGLQSISYPYSGSWDSVINHGRTSSRYVAQGYREMYGGITLVDYILSTKSGGWQTPDLWRTRHYPFHAIKQGHELFCDVLQTLQLGDEVGMVSYDSSHRVEMVLNKTNPLIPQVNITSNPITVDYEAVVSLMKYRQANEYSSSTNMGGGMKDGMWLLDNHKRDGARPTILLMTDGNTNTIDAGTDTSLPPDWDWDTMLDYDSDGSADYYTTSTHKHYILKLAVEALQKGYTIHTMSVGSDADRDFMEAVAYIGKGHWVDVPGGVTVDEMEDQLRAAFQEIATFVPPAKLVNTQ